MSEQNATRRGYGSGSLTTRAAADGSETWYGLWWSNGRRRKRRIGPKRAPGTRDGLTRTQAETELRRLMGETAPAPPKGGAITLRDLARRYLAHAERRGRKTSTRQNIESETRVHVVPYFGDRAVATITPRT